MTSIDETQNHDILLQTDSRLNMGDTYGMGMQSQSIPGDENEDQGFDPNNMRVSIKSTDMSENMILFIVEKSILAFEAAAYSIETSKAGQKLDHNTLISKFIKGEMELFYKPTWHVIVGDNYGGFFTHEEFNSIVFCMNDKWITVFKSNIPQKD